MLNYRARELFFEYIFLLLSFIYLNSFFSSSDRSDSLDARKLSPDKLAKYFRYLFFLLSLSLAAAAVVLRIIFNYIHSTARFVVDLLSEAHTYDFSVVSLWRPTMEATNSSRLKCIINSD